MNSSNQNALYRHVCWMTSFLLFIEFYFANLKKGDKTCSAGYIFKLMNQNHTKHDNFLYDHYTCW